MKNIVFLLAIALSILAVPAQAIDTDPGSGAYRTYWQGGQGYTASRVPAHQHLYYKPTQRYYGNGYVIAYGYVTPGARQLQRAPLEPYTVTAKTAIASRSASPRVKYVLETTSGSRRSKLPAIAEKSR